MREREREREIHIYHTIFFLYCRITCVTGVKQGSVVSDKVFIMFTHRSDRIESEENFEFVVS